MSAGLPQHLTLDYLRALLSRGVEKTTVTEEARMVLRKWVMDARRISGSPLPASVSAKPAANETRPKQPTPEQTPPDSVDEASFGNELRDILNGVQPHRTEEDAPVPRHISFDLEGETEEEKLSSLRELVVNWPPLRNMDSLRETPVFSSGNPKADIMMGKRYQGQVGSTEHHFQAHEDDDDVAPDNHPHQADGEQDAGEDQIMRKRYHGDGCGKGFFIFRKGGGSARRRRWKPPAGPDRR